MSGPKDAILLAIFDGVEVRAAIDDGLGNPRASRSDGADIVAMDVYELKSEGLVKSPVPGSNQRAMRTVELTPKGRERAEELRAKRSAG